MRAYSFRVGKVLCLWGSIRERKDKGLKPTLHKESRPRFNPKSSNCIDATTNEIGPKVFTLRFKAKKNLNNILIYDFLGYVLIPRVKKDINQLGLLICNPKGQCWSIKILVKKKFNLLFKQYKMDKVAIGVSKGWKA